MCFFIFKISLLNYYGGRKDTNDHKIIDNNDQPSKNSKRLYWHQWAKVACKEGNSRGTRSERHCPESPSECIRHSSVDVVMFYYALIDTLTLPPRINKHKDIIC